jgi:hypothetical protein
MRFIALAIISLCLSHCSCPKPPPTLPPKPPEIITVKEKCMDPLPPLPEGKVPEFPEDAETIALTKEQYSFMLSTILILAGYTHVQYEKCGKQ